MSMQSCIEQMYKMDMDSKNVVSMKDIRESEFEKYMNKPQKYEPTEEEVGLLFKIREITSRGSSVEIKESKNGYVVYEVRKNKR